MRNNGSIDRVSSRYDGEVSYVDHQLGRLLAELRAHPESWERTILVVPGDHGEGLGQHAEATHGSVWSEQLQAPLIMRIPSMARARIDRLVSEADVVPTLMGLSELPGEEMFLRQSSGVDRLGDAEASQTLIFSQESGLRAGARGARQPRYVLTGDEWKLIYDPDAENMRLFQLSNDPFELNDVSDEHAEIAQRLRKILLVRLDQQREREHAFGSISPSVDDEVDPAILEQLRALGYIQ